MPRCSPGRALAHSRRATGWPLVGAATTKSGAEGVVLIPCGRLGLLPLHAASFRHNGEITRLIEEFDVTYAPSARVLAAAPP